MVAQDSTNILAENELRANYKFLIELQFRRVQVNNQKEQLLIKSEIIKRKETQIELHNRIEKNLREQIEAINPKWYDNFLVGVGTGVVFTAIAVSLIK